MNPLSQHRADRNQPKLAELPLHFSMSDS